MRPTHVTSYDITAFFRRRKRLIIIPLILVSTICVVGAFILPRSYESSATLLVQRNEVSNPLVRFGIEQSMPGAMTVATEDRFKTFNEIIFSRQSMDLLLDSLRLSRPTMNEIEKQLLVKELSKKISTDKRGAETFRITFSDTDPLRTHRGATVLTNLFIKTNDGIDNQRNELAVQFFEKKLEDFRRKYESSQRQRVSDLKEQITQVPAEDRLIYNKMEDVDRRVQDIDLRIKNYRQSLVILQTFPEAFESDAGRQGLFELEHADVPFAGELHALASKYDDFMRRYTPRYPEISLVKSQILDLLGRIKSAVQIEIGKLQNQRGDLEQTRHGLVANIKESSIVEHAQQEKESNYTIYLQLYDEMKVKLEQARTARDLGRKGANQFVVIDPPLIPTEPSKPNRSLIIAGGLAIGMLIGLALAIMAELLDATIRTTKDIEIYQKPIIAFIPESHAGLRN